MLVVLPLRKRMPVRKQCCHPGACASSSSSTATTTRMEVLFSSRLTKARRERYHHYWRTLLDTFVRMYKMIAAAEKKSRDRSRPNAQAASGGTRSRPATSSLRGSVVEQVVRGGTGPGAGDPGLCRTNERSCPKIQWRPPPGMNCPRSRAKDRVRIQFLVRRAKRTPGLACGVPAYVTLSARTSRRVPAAQSSY